MELSQEELELMARARLAHRDYVLEQMLRKDLHPAIVGKPLSERCALVGLAIEAAIHDLQALHKSLTTEKPCLLN